MNQDTHFLPADKLIKISKKKMDLDVIKNIQNFTDKIITDIINRSALLAKHNDKDLIEVNEVAIIIEKDFDYSFGARNIIDKNKPPAFDHIEKMAEISRQK